MKHSILLALAMILASCGVEKTESNSANGMISDAETTQTTIDPLPEPCIVSGAEMTAILGWKKGSEGRPNGINGEFMKACDYGSNSGNVQVAFKRYKERDIESKWLEGSYKKQLGGDGGKLTYQEVADGFGDQTIFSFGKEGPINAYMLKWRVGNHTEKSVRFTSSSKQKADEMLEKLKQVAAKIEG